MSAVSKVTQPQSARVHYSVRLRLLPESKSVPYQLADTARACCFVWNHFLACKQQAYADYKAGMREKALKVFFYGSGKEFTALRRYRSMPGCKILGLTKYVTHWNTWSMRTGVLPGSTRLFQLKEQAPCVRRFYDSPECHDGGQPPACAAHRRVAPQRRQPIC